MVRVGLLGAGAWGANHLRVWSELGCLRAVCDADPVRLAKAVEKLPGVEAVAEAGALINRPDLDAVVIATPAATHAALARQALASGKDVLVEKPLALSAAEAAALAAQAERLGRVLMVGHVLEFHPVVEKLRELIHDGALGKLRYLYSNRLNFGRIRTEESALWSFAPHDVALMLRLIGTMPAMVASSGGAYLDEEVADVTMTTLAFPGGVRAHIYVSWLHPFKEHRFVVIGDRQMAVFDDTRPWSERLVLYPHQVDWVEGRVPVARKASATPVPLTEAEPLTRECEHFLACVASRARPLTDGISGLAVIRVLEAAQLSLDQGGRPERLEPASPAAAPSAAPGAAPPAYHAHASASVDAGAEIGAGTRIWHYSHVMKGAKIGPRCVLGQNVFVAPNVRLGAGVKVQNNVSIYEGVEIEDEVFCGPSMVFTNVINPRSAIERKSEFRPTRVGKGATLGANCTIVCGHDVGRYAFVAAGAVVTRDVPDHGLVAGVPARLQGWVCECGVRLPAGGEGGTCPACGLRFIGSRTGLRRADAASPGGVDPAAPTGASG